MRNLIVIFGILICTTSLTQELIIESGGMYIDNNSVLSLYNIGIKNNSELIAHNNTTVAINSNQTNLLITGSNPLLLNNLMVIGNVTLNLDAYLLGNLDITNGNLDISDYNLTINGNIIGEKENTRVFTRGFGEIIKTVSLQPNTSINPGNIGLEIKAMNANSNIILKRGHTVNYNNNSESISRYFSFSEINQPFKIIFNYFDTELNNLNEDRLSIWGEKSGQWEELNSAINTNNNYLAVEINNSYQKLSLFENSEQELIFIPNGFSPNGDGVNDYFIIEGAEHYPNNKLIILNQWGDVVFESEHYGNDWGGTCTSGIIYSHDKILLNGTYFYFFYKDINNKKDLEKGFFEIKGKTY